MPNVSATHRRILCLEAQSPKALPSFGRAMLQAATCERCTESEPEQPVMGVQALRAQGRHKTKKYVYAYMNILIYIHIYMRTYNVYMYMCVCV